MCVHIYTPAHMFTHAYLNTALWLLLAGEAGQSRVCLGDRATAEGRDELRKKRSRDSVPRLKMGEGVFFVFLFSWGK